MAESTSVTGIDQTNGKRKNRGGRPPERIRGAIRPDDNNPEPKFFDLMREVSAEDWGVRAFIYVYVTGPLCNLKRQGGKTYLVRCDSPITIQKLMEDYGSFAGYMTLNRRKAGGNAGDLIDRYDFEIYNPKYPPKIPKDVWITDPRNDKWAALLPKDAPQPQASGDPQKMLEFFLSSQERIAERMGANGANGTGLAELVDAAGTILDMARPKTGDTPAAAQPTTDPWAAAERILNMRSSNPMLEMMQRQLDANTALLNDERAARARLESEMLKAEVQNLKEQSARLTEQLSKAANPADIFDQLDKLTDRKEKIAKALGLATEQVAQHAGPKMPWWVSAVKEIITPFATPLAGVLMSRFMAPGPQFQGPQPPPPPSAPQAQNGQAPPQPNAGPVHPLQDQGFMRWIDEYVSPGMLKWVENDADGGDYADAIFAVAPERFQQMISVTHPMMPGISGAPVIIELYKRSPWWAKIGPLYEARFTKFVQDFCAWKPDQPEQPGDIIEAETEEAPERGEV